MKKVFFIILLISAAALSQAQITYYQIEDGTVMDFFEFEKYKKTLSTGLVIHNSVSTRTAQDSVIQTVKVTVVDSNPDSNYYDPFLVHRKKIGDLFPMEEFIASDSSGIDDVDYTGKPTVVNFWFTRCGPCIIEIPYLNQLEQEFNGEVNFVAITFDKDYVVNHFLDRKAFNFEHITDVRPAIDAYGVQAFPMNLLLDKDGRIVQVYGDIIAEHLNLSATLREMVNE
ncbi:TlpA family protein disulfide reductase [Nonlabens ulvanivorans]|uniref:TlpA family protein disulfide reductase n=1 Tax=Nonlabens ulvanivorans TaxID=906888 RepID=UPI002942A66E|nr:TlpA disulfide reductase family protein [Nonlabens ulvanivorans]WOI23080.1 TlpA disulfide reductase family protein [Nonlabens ulvanivorans]